jgi:hypothetical protein
LSAAGELADLDRADAEMFATAKQLMNERRLVSNGESRRERLFSRHQHDTNKNANKSGGWNRTRTNGDEHRCKRSAYFQGFPSYARTAADVWERT